jgi:hypothetical protein
MRKKCPKRTKYDRDSDDCLVDVSKILKQRKKTHKYGFIAGEPADRSVGYGGYSEDIIIVSPSPLRREARRKIAKILQAETDLIVITQEDNLENQISEWMFEKEMDKQIDMESR